MRFSPAILICILLNQAPLAVAASETTGPAALESIPVGVPEVLGEKEALKGRALPPISESVTPARPSRFTDPIVTPNAPPSRPPATLMLPRKVPTSGVDGSPTLSTTAAPATLLPPEMIAQAMELPTGAELTGRPLTLVEALSSARDSRRQLDVTHAYWQLAAMVAEYNLRHRQSAILASLKARAGDEAMLRTARAAADASLGEARLAVVAAQHELAQRASLPTAELLPLPMDRPHVGPYRTHFTELFSGRPAPSRSRLIDRTLPIRQRAIDRRAEAVRAAEESLAATQKAYGLAQVDLEAVLSAMTQLGHQRRAFVRSVCDYNHDIADYVVAVLRRPTKPAALVAMLIKPMHPIPEPAVPGGVLGGNPAGRNLPTLAPSQHPVRQAGNIESIAPPAGSTVRPWADPKPVPIPSDAAHGKSAPTLAPPSQATPSRRAMPPTDDGPSDTPTPASTRELFSPPDEIQPLVPLRDEVEPEEKELPKLPVLPVAPSLGDSPKPTLRATNKPVTESRTSGLYPALVDASPAARAKQLAAALHWDRELPPNSGQTTTLANCLGMQTNGDRYGLIATYWQTRGRAAEYQVLSQQAQWLDGVAPLLPDETFASGAPARNRLRAARLATDADLLDAHARLIESEFALTQLAGQPLDAPWLLPSTVPHSGEYRVKLDVQPRALAESWMLRRRAAMIPALGETVQKRALAVVEADTARAAEMTRVASGTASVDRLLECTYQQTDQTLAFLRTLTDYNRAIAEYVVAVLPRNIPTDELARSLVVR